MKLLYLSPTRFPTERAHGAQIAHMCNAFAQNGLNAMLLAPKRKVQVSSDPYDFYKIPHSFSVNYTPCLPWGVSTKLGFFSNLLIYIIWAIFSVVLTKADIYYSRDEFVLYPLTFFLLPNRLIWESHEAKYNFAVRRLLKKGVKIIVISEGIRDFYMSKGFPENQFLVAHDGIDESFFAELETKKEARERLGISSLKPVIMYIGGLDPWKGVEIFFVASKYNDTVQYVIIGGREEEVQKYSAVYPNIQFLGQRPYSELKDNQQAADILVIPNTGKNDLSAKFTSPLKLFAHLASNVPLVVSDVPSLRNVVSEGQVTFFEPDDPKDLAEKLLLVLSDTESAQNKAKNAYELSKRYTWTSRARSILNFAKE